MAEPESTHDDCLNGMLRADSAPDSSDALRTAVLLQTVGVIRFRRRVKKCVLAALLLGCYLAGMATTGLWRPSKDRQPSSSAAPTVVATESQEAEPTVIPLPAIRPVEPSHVVRPPSESSRQIGVIGRPVGAPRKNRVQMMRENADRHLLERGDVTSALRGYACALNLAPASQRAIRPEQDSWLFMALKDSKIKEIRRERTFVD